MRRLGGALLLLALAGGTGCFLSETSVTNPRPLPADYVAPTAPESVLVNLAVAHSRRDPAAFTDLLAPEYTFRFAGVDTPVVGRSSLTRSEEIQVSGELLTSSQVAGLSVVLPHGVPIPAADVRFPAGTMLIRVVSPDVEIRMADGTRWIVPNPQEFYFRPGSTENGEDPTHWFLLEWDEDAPISKPGPVRIPSPEPVRGTGWGQLKMMFWEGA
jgi:hypothetical protein